MKKGASQVKQEKNGVNLGQQAQDHGENQGWNQVQEDIPVIAQLRGKVCRACKYLHNVRN